MGGLNVLAGARFTVDPALTFGTVGITYPGRFVPFPRGRGGVGFATVALTGPSSVNPTAIYRFFANIAAMS